MKSISLLKFKLIIKFLLILGLFIYGSTSCTKRPTTGDLEGSSTDPNNVGDTPPEKSFLWLHHKGVKGALRYTHKTTSSGPWLEQCKVDLDAANASDREITCITESNELDLAHIGLTLEYNVPTHPNCPYVATMSPYFFRFPPQTVHPNIPPAYVYVYENSDTGADQAWAYYNSPTPTLDISNINNPVITGTQNSNFSTKGSQFKCGYDYSSDPPGKNCCEGDYTEISINVTNNAATVKSTAKKWGGKISNCLDGPALKDRIDSNTGFPVMTIWRMEEQIDQGNTLNKNFQNPVELLSKFNTSFEIKLVEEEPSNFGKFEVPGYLEDYSTSMYLSTYYSGTMPLAFDYIKTYYPISWANTFGDPRYFTVTCLDYNMELYAQIRLAVREWNTYSALKAATEPTAGEDNTTGSENPPFDEYPLNDRDDWGDNSYNFFPAWGL